MALEIVGIVLFVALIGASIALHELGHLVPAKKFGVRVPQYMVGFGPTVWSKRSGETEYGVKLFPIGGYIRMIGMLPPAKGESTSRSMTTGRFATLIADARAASLDEVQPGDENRLFYRLPVHRRLIIMIGGPFMNLVLAVILFTIVLVGIGLPAATTTVGSVVACTPTATGSVTPLPSGECPVGTQETPAARVGIESGDIVVAVNGAPVESWEQASAVLRASADQSISVTLDRGGQIITVEPSIVPITREAFDSAGNPTGATETVGFLGVSPQMQYEGQSISTVPGYMADLTVRSVQALVSLPVRLYELVSQTLIGGQERSLDSPVSVVGASRLGGEIVAMESPWQAKVATFLGLAASLNLFLFLFNLLPVLPLDGGHAAGASYEGIRRWWAKIRRRPDPGPVDTARLLPVAYVVAAVLLGAGVIVIWADLVRPLTLGG